MIKKLFLIFLFTASCSARPLYVLDASVYKDTLADCNIYIGNPDKPAEFQSHVKMEFWDGEDSISFHEEGVKGTPGLENEIITLDLPTRKLEWFVTDDKAVHWVEILKEKPATNKWTLKISDGDQFNYYFQTKFADESTQIPGSSLEYFTRNNEEWIRLVLPPGLAIESSERPLDVDGSIAVYHKTKRDHAFGGKNYLIGKVSHILRPEAVGANSKTVWCDIQVKGGFYTRTVPWSILNDPAAYPIRINDVFGYNTIGGTPNNMSDLYMYASDKGQPAASGSATKMYFYGERRSATTNVCLGIWSDSASEPLTLLRDTGAIVVDSDTPQWWSGNLDSAYALDSANTYWLGSCSDTDTGHVVNYDSDGEASFYEYYALFNGNTLTNFSSPTGGQAGLWSVYLDYTPSVAAEGQVIFINVN